MSEFSDRPFAAGSLIGLRAFSVDSLGRLTGPSHGGVFKPGENVAKCPYYGEYEIGSFAPTLTFRVRAFEREPQRAAGRISTEALASKPSVEEPIRPKLEPPKHQVAKKDCTCGFYAYFDGSNDYAGTDCVRAIVEGYGVCTVGTRGFRAEKARLVALVMEEEPSDLRIPRGIYEFLYRHGWLAGASSGAFMAGFIGAIGALAGDLPTWTLALSIAAMVLSAFLIWATFKAIDVHHGNRRRSSTPFDLVRRNYPDVPIYRTEKAALKAHPLTPPPLPSADEPDFWERSA